MKFTAIGHLPESGVGTANDVFENTPQRAVLTATQIGLEKGLKRGDRWGALEQEREHRPTCDPRCRRSLDEAWINRQRELWKSKGVEKGYGHSSYFGGMDHYEREQADKDHERYQLA
jgi:hypothetical protein